VSDRALQARVLVVGGGPVGLVLAMCLARHGVDVLLVEMRHAAEPPSVKCNHVSARSMEVFRQLGVASAVRDSGLPADHPHDVAYRTTTTGDEIARIPIPCRRDRFTDVSGPDGRWPTPEPPHRINQLFLEPVLASFAATMPGLRVMNRLEMVDCAQDEHGVVAEACDLGTGERVGIRCEFLVGCDGPRSLVRRKIGARLVGTDFIGRPCWV
jgi:2-polyprenyl-6-methoxyphenol hydroxylase-like FAD-dependent oxidoreductase